MKLLCLVIISFFSFHQLFAQPTTPKDFGLKAFHIKDKELGEINFYVSNENINQKLPLILELDGSGYFPLATLVKSNSREQVFTFFDRDILNLAYSYHVVLISKPGIKFCDTVVTHSDVINTDSLANLLKPTKEFLRRNSLSWRVNSASRVIDYLMHSIPVDTTEVVAYGYSEGGQVVPKLSLVNRHITHCISVAGGGLNQFYDFITDLRVRAASGKISRDRAQQQIDSLYQIFSDIYKHPKDVNKQWEGNSYLRWASYTADAPLNSLVKLHIPILMIACGNDVNSPVYGLDYVKLDFLRLGKSNLTYKVYPDCDHFFNETIDKDGKTIVVNHKKEMIDFVISWLNNNTLKKDK